MLSPVSCPVEIVAKTIFPLGTTVLYVQFLGDFWRKEKSWLAFASLT
jgi:hypothetical protein